MAGKRKTILDDPRYEVFVERYHADPLRFAVEVCNFIPSQDQIDLFNALVEPMAKVSVVSGTGCFAKGTMMMCADGSSVAVEDIKVGDTLMGDDGKSIRNVLELKRGREMMYRFTYQDGSSHIFNESHILCLVNTYDKNGRKAGDKCTPTVKEYLEWNKTKKRSHAVYRNGVDSFFRRDNSALPIPPYILGVWIGDGVSSKAAISNPDQEIIDEWANYVSSKGCLLRVHDQDRCPTWNAARINGTKQANPITELLRSIGVLDNKHVPDQYLFASYEDRLELLAGLIDTDGYYDEKANGYDFIQKSEQIANSVVFLARSVGLHATIKPARKRCTNNDVWGDYFRVYIGRGISKIPVRVERKKSKKDNEFYSNLYYGIKSVEFLGEGDYYGFVLDGNSQFLGADFTVLHNTGKTSSFGRIVLWHLLCHPVAMYDGKIEIGSNTYIGSPNVQQTQDGVFKEVADAVVAISNGEFAWILEYIIVNKTTVVIKGFESQWYVSTVALQKGKAVGVAGKHRYWQMIIIDEAAGVGDEHFDVIEGTQTQGGNRTLLASQGVRNAGRFYETHHNLNKLNGGSWTALTFSSERSPFVTTQWLKDREQETGGRNSIEYRIRVLGQFAENSGTNLLTRADLEPCFEPRKIIGDDEPYGLVVLADVGLGEYRDDSVAVVAKIVGYGDHGDDARRVEYIEIPLCTNEKNEIDFAGDLVNMTGRLSNATLYVDHGGVGATVTKLIERSGVNVEKVDWGKPCFKRAYRERFYNQRACAMVRFRDAVRQGRVVFPQVDKRLREKIMLQGSRLPYHFAEAGGLRYVMDRKEDMRKNGIKSPDIIDAMSFAFLEQTSYVVAENKASNATKSKVEHTRDKAKDALSELDNL